jgi:hypothetical protein
MQGAVRSLGRSNFNDELAAARKAFNMQGAVRSLGRSNRQNKPVQRGSFFLFDYHLLL